MTIGEYVLIEEPTSIEAEQFIEACLIRSEIIINRLTGGKASQILDTHGEKYDAIRRAIAGQVQYMITHQEELADDCDTVSGAAMVILSNAGLLEVHNDTSGT